MNKQYKVISSSPDSCTERFRGTKEECEQWVKDNKYRFPGYVTLKIQPAEESAKWGRDFDIHSGESIYEKMNKIDDSEALERENVKTQRKTRKLKEYNSDKIKKPITEHYATKQFEIPNFDAEIVDEFEDEGIKGYNIVYSKNGTDIVEVEVWEIDSPVAVNRNLHTPGLMQGYYSSFDAFASDLEYKTSRYVHVRESASKNLSQKVSTDKFKESVDEKYNVRTLKDVKNLHESTEHSDAWKAAYSKLNRAAEDAKLHLDADFVEYALEDDGADVEDVIENEVTYVGDVLKKEFPNLAFWKFLQDERFSAAIQVYSRPKNSRRFSDVIFEGNYELAHDRLYPIDVK